MERMKRPARLLGLACLIPLAVTGCRTIVPTKPAASPNAPPTPPNAARPSAAQDGAGSIVKTEFHRKPTTDQQFNVHLELGKQQMRDSQFESALAEFKKALKACEHPTGLRTGAHRTEQQALAHRKIGSALGSLGKFPEAEEHMKQAAKLTPNDPRVWNDMGYTYYMQSRWADAERCLQRAAKLDPDSPLVKTNLGLAVANDGRMNEARELLSGSAGKAVGHANLGFALAAQGRLVEARDEYHKALELQPQLPVAQQALARLDNPKASEPLVNAPPHNPRLAPGVPAPAATTVAMPSSVPVPQPIAVYRPGATPAPAAAPASPSAPVASERPSDPAVSEVKLTPPGAGNTSQNAPAAPPADIELRPTSYNSVKSFSPAATTPAAASPPFLAPVPTPAAAPAAPRSPAKPANATPAPAPAVPVSARAGGAIPPPRPVAAAPKTAQNNSIPMPVPAPSKRTTAKPVSIPMPVPVARHLATPALERDANATSAPAPDLRVPPRRSADY
jgi:Flp pilus assembly protein TadD